MRNLATLDDLDSLLEGVEPLPPPAAPAPTLEQKYECLVLLVSYLGRMVDKETWDCACARTDNMRRVKRDLDIFLDQVAS